MANIYKSNYTGAQVDDAVKKVLAAAPAENDKLITDIPDISIINNTSTTPSTDTVDVVTKGEATGTNKHTISNSRVKVPTQKYVDNKVADYLPLLGGTVTGDLKSTGTNPIESTNGFKKTDFDNTYVLLAGGGAKLLSELGGGGSGGATLANGTTLYLHRIQLIASSTGMVANFNFYSDKGGSYSGDLTSLISDLGSINNLSITNGSVSVDNHYYTIAFVQVYSNQNQISISYFDGTTYNTATTWTSVSDKVAKMASLGGDVTDVTFGGTGSALTVIDENLSLVDGLHIRGKMPELGTPYTVKLNNDTALYVRTQKNGTPTHVFSAGMVVEFIYNSSVGGGVWQIWGVDSVADSIYNFVGVKDKASNGQTTNGNTYLKLYENGGKQSQFNIKGTGATSVTSDANGNITINSTDNDTKVTSVENHYTPTANSASAIEKDASSTTEATWGTTSLVTGVNIQRDAKGHVTGMTLDSIKMPAKPETSSSNVVLPFISLSLSSSSYPISGTFTEEQANKLISAPYSAVVFTPAGSATQIPLLLQPSDIIHYSYIYQGNDDNYIYTLTATLNKNSSSWATKSYTIARGAKTTAVTSLGGKTGAITLGSGLSISSDNILSATGGGSSSSSIEIIDLGNIGSFPASNSLTTEQLNKFISWGNNGINAVQIYDQTEPGGTMPIMVLNGNYQNRSFYYTGIWSDNKYIVSVDLDNDFNSSPSSGTYYVTKSSLSGGSSSGDNEQKAYLGTSFQFSTYGQSSYVSTNVDSSVAGLTDAEITGLIFDCQKSQYNGTTTLASYSYQLKLNDLYRMFTSDSSGAKSANMTIFNQQLSLVFSEISTSYSQGTVNYNIPIMITPSFNLSDDVLNINIGFTYKGFKFANGGTY